MLGLKSLLSRAIFISIILSVFIAYACTIHYQLSIRFIFELCNAEYPSIFKIDLFNQIISFASFYILAVFFIIAACVIIYHSYIKLLNYSSFKNFVPIAQEALQHITIGLLAYGAINLAKKLGPTSETISKYVIVAIIVLFYGSFKKLNSQTKDVELLKKVGLFFYSPNSSDSHQEECNAYIREEAESASNVRIICSTGFNTFSSTDAPLYNALEKCQFQEAKILISYPFCPEADKRANKIGIPVSVYQNHVIQSVKFLESLHEKGDGKIQLKMYRRYPFWRIILIDGLSFIQQYPETAKINVAPFYAFVYNKSYEYGFHNITWPLFNRLWNYKTNGHYNFEKKEVTFPEAGIFPFP
jgi:hypothetical protein